MTQLQLKPRLRNAIISALRAGVVPRQGLQHIQVGRVNEVAAFLRNLQAVKDGEGSVSFVIGPYGGGKTYMLELEKVLAHEHKFVTMSADLTPDRRLHSANGHVRSLYTELARNMATRSLPEGGAMHSVVEIFIMQCKEQADADGKTVDEVVMDSLVKITDMVNGFDFATVIKAYYKGFVEKNDQLKMDAVRWLRGEFTSKTDARAALGVRSIIDDASVYDQLKLMAMFCKVAGYDGLFIYLDEMVNLYKLQNAQSRNANYEQILRIINDVAQGRAPYLGVVFGGTPEFLNNPKRGLYSYEALQTRLMLNKFAQGGSSDFSGPVIQLSALGSADYYLLLTKVRDVYQSGTSLSLPDVAIQQFLTHCADRLGDKLFKTPRRIIITFLDLLAVLEQSPETSWQALIGDAEVQEDNGDVADGQAGDTAPAGENSKAQVPSAVGQDPDLYTITL